MCYIKHVRGYSKILFLVLILLILSSCAKNEKEVVTPVNVNVVSHKQERLIIPHIDTFVSKPVNWSVVTKNNMNDKIKDEKAYFVIDATGYANLSENTSKMLTIISQQKRIIQMFSNN